ncbi:hypothetical protein EPO05_01345 [Patescibacteria group bacterium]|nr:MAG: hypothetical protein EPO05_01345 [Patescibacteria group bacterium]
MRLKWKCLALLPMVTLILWAVDCSAEPLKVKVVDDRGNPVGGATVRGMIEFENGSHNYFENTTDENGVAEVECGEGIRVYFWVEKYGWWQNTYPNKGPNEIPEAVKLFGIHETINVVLTKKNNAQFY